MPSPRALVHLAYLALVALPSGLAAHASPGDPPPSRALLEELTSITRLAGTSGSARAAQWVARELERAGLTVELDEREVLLSLPERLDLKLFADVLATTPFHESYDSFDADQIPAMDVPAFSAWSRSGEVRGQVIDAGFGLRADFERLLEAGVDPKDKIALVRYGRAYRGVKVALASEFGCKAVLLFSDPESDGAAKGETWPVGPWKSDWAAQRGAILDIATQPGDPSTPGFPSPAPGADSVQERLAGAELDASLPGILCLPVSAAQAAEMLAKLRVRRVPGDSPDAEQVRRPVGPGPVEALVHVEAPRTLRRIVNVVARIEGASEQTVMLGNHRDSWVRGAHDAGSGTVALLRAAQTLGKRARQGWRPAHSIAFAFWDAEEFGLIGSTEWAEGHRAWVRDNLLVYVNGDAVVGGDRFFASGSPGMESVLARALAEVRDPGDSERSLAQAWLAASDGAGRLRLPGSGSDFAVFAHHFMVPVLDLGFGGASGGQYHTSFDDFSFVERFIDPDFSLHESAGELFAAVAVELAAAGPLALDEARAAQELARHAREAADGIGSEASERLAAGFDALEEAIRDTWSAWSATDESPDPVEAGSRRGSPPTSADAMTDAGGSPSRTLVGLDLGASEERLFVRLAKPAGLTGRPWYRNPLWAPSIASGYAAETFPELRSSAGRTEEARENELNRLLEAIEAHRMTWTSRLPAPN